MKIFEYERNNYTLYGILFGLCFPIGATLLEILINPIEISITSILALHKQIHFLWMIDTAPVVLGLFARLAGQKQDSVNAVLNDALIAVEEKKLAIEVLEKNEFVAKLFSDIRDLAIECGSEQEFATKNVGLLTQVIEAKVGVFYLLDDSGLLNPVGTYGVDSETFQSGLALGESIVGQAAKDGKTIKVEGGVAEFLEIQSGLGKASADVLVLSPVSFGEKVLGVLVFGFFQKLGSEKLNLVGSLSEASGRSLVSLTARKVLDS